MQLLPIYADDAQIQAALANPKRLAAVRETDLLDSPSEESFDRLTRLAAKLTGVPASFIALLDTDRDFYKSAFCVGAPPNAPREVRGRTFCQHALAAGETLVIADATQSPVFSEVPTVKSLGVRAYAGIPIKSAEGDVLGTLCAVDFEPKQWMPWQIEVLVELAHSAEREILLRRALRDAEAANQQLLAQLRRVDELNRALNELAQTDALTGLSNKRAFDHRLEAELASVVRRHAPLSLLMVDIDHFKRINDSLGHHMGDKILVAVTEVLSRCARITDMVARVGGEEFAVILPDTDSPSAQEVAERMRAAVAESHWLEQPTTVSIGAATLQPEEDAVSLYTRADTALYEAKKTGRNRVMQAP